MLYQDDINEAIIQSLFE